MTARTILFMLLALVMAGGTAFYARNLILKERQASLLQNNTEEVVQVQNSMMVLVAKDMMNTGSFVDENSFEWLAWPEDGISSSYISVHSDDLENDQVDADMRLSYVGAVAKQTVQAGQPVTKEQFAMPGDRGFMAAVLRQGNRAVTVPISEATGIGGFAFPGDRVDLVLSLKLTGEDVKGQSITRYVSLTLVSDVRVLAIGQMVQNEEGEPILAKTATIEVAPKQAEKVALGLTMGSLSLSLRGLQEQTASINGETEDALEAFLKTGGKPDGDGRNYTMDVEVFTVNGMDTSLKQYRPKEKGAAPPPTVTVLRGGEAEKG